jgi:hypothetical protein
MDHIGDVLVGAHRARGPLRPGGVATRVGGVEPVDEAHKERRQKRLKVRMRGPKSPRGLKLKRIQRLLLLLMGPLCGGAVVVVLRVDLGR